jgi:hypothetical protein
MFRVLSIIEVDSSICILQVYTDSHPRSGMLMPMLLLMHVLAYLITANPACNLVSSFQLFVRLSPISQSC